MYFVSYIWHDFIFQYVPDFSTVVGAQNTGLSSRCCFGRTYVHEGNFPVRPLSFWGVEPSFVEQSSFEKVSTRGGGILCNRRRRAAELGVSVTNSVDKWSIFR